MAQTNWMRRVSLKCGSKGGTGIRLGNYDSVNQKTLHIAFSVEKSDSETANTAKVQVWNLSQASLNVLDQSNGLLELRAGYGDNMALILTGNIETVTTTISNADRVTEIEVTDGGVALRDVVISVSFNGTTFVSEIYKYIAKQMGMAIVYTGVLGRFYLYEGDEDSYYHGFRTLPNGFSFVGTAASALTKAASICGHKWSIQNGVLQIYDFTSTASQKAYILSAETGLIGIPTRISITSSSDSDVTESGYEVQYLLNGAIGINDVVRIQSNDVNGDFRVRKITFDGDNMEGDWVCTAQVLAVS